MKTVSKIIILALTLFNKTVVAQPLEVGIPLGDFENEIYTISEGSIFIEPKKALIEIDIEHPYNQTKGYGDAYLSFDQAQMKLKSIKDLTELQHVDDIFQTQEASLNTDSFKKSTALKISRRYRATVQEIAKVGTVLDSILNTVPSASIKAIKLIKNDRADYSSAYKSITEQLIAKLRSIAQSSSRVLDEKSLIVNFSEEPSSAEIRGQLAENPNSTLDSGGKEIKIVGQIKGKLLK